MLEMLEERETGTHTRKRETGDGRVMGESSENKNKSDLSVADIPLRLIPLTSRSKKKHTRNTHTDEKRVDISQRVIGVVWRNPTGISDSSLSPPICSMATNNNNKQNKSINKLVYIANASQADREELNQLCCVCADGDRLFSWSGSGYGPGHRAPFVSFLLLHLLAAFRFYWRDNVQPELPTDELFDRYN